MNEQIEYDPDILKGLISWLSTAKTGRYVIGGLPNQGPVKELSSLIPEVEKKSDIGVKTYAAFELMVNIAQNPEQANTTFLDYVNKSRKEQGKEPIVLDEK